MPGIHLAGVVIGGRHTGEIFIENGRFHGKQIIEALKARVICLRAGNYVERQHDLPVHKAVC